MLLKKLLIELRFSIFSRAGGSMKRPDLFLPIGETSQVSHGSEPAQQKTSEVFSNPFQIQLPHYRACSFYRTPEDFGSLVKFRNYLPF